jgi:hypothetical protein
MVVYPSTAWGRTSLEHVVLCHGKEKGQLDLSFLGILNLNHHPSMVKSARSLYMVVSNTPKITGNVPFRSRQRFETNLVDPDQDQRASNHGCV